MLERVLIGLLCNGHVLLEGVPGLAKTLTRAAPWPRRIAAQFIAHPVHARPAARRPRRHDRSTIRSGSLHRAASGPVFANIVLADEINRAPAKVQIALLEAMQERQVTIGDKTHALPSPFLVLATQNPIEQEGTYPLPEAQVDRFMLKIKVGYPTREEERLIMRPHVEARRRTASAGHRHRPICARARASSHEIYVDAKIKEYMVDLVFATREPRAHGSSELARATSSSAPARARPSRLNQAAKRLRVPAPPRLRHARRREGRRASTCSATASA